MSHFDFGIYQGAAAQMPYDSMMDREVQLRTMERQNRIDAENKAKLMGDDYKTASVDTPYLQQKLNDFYTGHFKNMGDFYIKNPDLMYNPLKQMQWQQMKDMSLNNPVVAENMNYKTNYMNYAKWLADNVGHEDDPDVQRMAQELESYKNTGTIDSTGKTIKPFVFVNPDMKVDMPTLLRDHFGKTEQHGIKWISGNKADGYVETATDDDMYNAARSFLSDKKNNRVIENQWKQLSPDAKAVYSNDVVKYVAQMGKPFAARDIVHPATDYNPNAGGRSSGAGGAGGTIIPLKSALLQSTQPGFGFRAEIDPKALDAIYKNNDGHVDLSTGDMLSTAGNVEDLTDANSDLNIKPLTPQQRQQLSAIKAEPIGQVSYDPKKDYFYTNWKVKMTPAEIKQFWGHNKMIDFDGAPLGGARASEDGSDSFSIHGGQELWNPEGDWTHMFQHSPEDDSQGNTKHYVSFMIRKPIQNPNDPTLHYRYNKAIGSKEENMGFDTRQPEAEPASADHAEGTVVKMKDGKNGIIRGKNPDGSYKVEIQ